MIYLCMELLHQIDKMLYVRIGELKEHLKKKITRNNEKLNEIHTTSVDSLIDDDGQGGVIGEVRTEPSFVSSKIESALKNNE